MLFVSFGERFMGDNKNNPRADAKFADRLAYNDMLRERALELRKYVADGEAVNSRVTPGAAKLLEILAAVDEADADGLVVDHVCH